MLAVMVRGFQVPMSGSFLLLLALSVAFILAEVGWWVMISSFSRTQQQAILFVFMVAMVDMTLAGYLVSPGNPPGPFPFRSPSPLFGAYPKHHAQRRRA